MYAFDNKRHHLPHFHVEYTDDSAVVSIVDGEVLEGSLGKPKMKLVQAWVEIHREDLMADWKLAIAGQPVMRIKPLE
jgi:hypothetical protein